MPSAQEVADYRALRGRFLNALWDEEARTATWVLVQIVLSQIAPFPLSDVAVKRLVEDLVADDLIHGVEVTYDEPDPTHVRLTPQGRAEVERWIATDAPTDHLPIPPSTIINNFHGAIQSSPIVQQSSGTTIHIHSVIGQQLADVASKASQLLEDQTEIDEDDREDLSTDIETLLASAQQSDHGKISACAKTTYEVGR